MSNNDEKRDLFIFELIRNRIESDWERIRSLDNKANNLIGFVSITIGIFFASGAIGTISFFTLKLELVIFLTIGIIALLSSFFLSMFAFKIRKWEVVPDISKLLEKYSSSPLEEIIHVVGGTMISASEKTQNQIHSKAKFLNYSWYSLFTGLVSLIIFIVFYTKDTVG